ncbi:MAG TPA: exonuclease domain-containing protein, partial [Roseimicrobium sp.]|nr:exonuclease domain-containing protein [Roseimicrobium sp.]
MKPKSSAPRSADSALHSRHHFVKIGRSMPISLIQSLRDVPLAVLDFETTGAAAELGDRVVEIGIVRMQGGQVLERYSQLVDPQRRISPGASYITGITQDMVTGQPTFADIR